MKKYLVILLLIFTNNFIFSQKVENVSFDVINNKIVVNYDITTCPENENYDLIVKFLDENNKTIFPKSVSGDLNNISCGIGKTIVWEVLNDQDELSGNLKAYVNIIKRHKTKIEGGPENAFLSLLVPGLGDKMVNINNSQTLVKPYFITIVTYGAVGYGLFSRLQSKKFYDKYHKATTQTQMDDYYKQANDNNHNFITYTSIGASIWLCDIIFVAIKGSRNRKNQLMYSSVYTPNKLYFTCNDKGFQFNYIIRF